MANEPTLLIGDVPGISLDFSTTLYPNQYLRLRHRLRYWGGHWELTFYLSDSDFTSGQIDDYFNSWLMRQVAEYFNGAIAFRGVVWEMVRNKDGKRQRRSMANVWNAIKCVYTTVGNTEQLETAYQEDDASISRYLRREYIIYRDGISSTQAAGEAAAFLATSYDAWPVSTDFNTNSEDGLEITVFGMSRLLNNVFCTVTTPAGLVEISTFVDDIYDTDIAPFFSFIGLGYLGANTYEVEREQRTPTRVGDLIDALARLGDSTIPYKWGVSQDLLFNFTPFVATPTLEWNGRSGGGVYKVGGGRATWDAVPGVMNDKTIAPIPSLPGSFLQQRNHELVEQFSMWQGQDQPQPELENPTEEQLLADAARYQRMITDGNFDRLHTPGSTIEGR